MNLDLIVGGTVPVITSNFDALKAAIQERLEVYKIQVTEENLAQAKKDATELGKAALQLNKLKTEKAREFSAPVDAFKAQVMELVGMIQAGQDFIKKQVAVFEDKTRAICRGAMEEALNLAYQSQGVREEYQTGHSKIEPLVGISKVTAKGSLTKAAQESITLLASQDRGTQDLVEGRIARLEAECYKAGLSSPLTLAHVQNIIKADDMAYTAGLLSLIQIELGREEETRKKLQAEEERKARAKIEEEEKQKRLAEIEEKKKALREVPPIPPAPPAPPAPVIPPPAPIVAPAPSFAFPAAIPPAPLKSKITVIVRFHIETTKTSPEDIEKTRQWFEANLSKLPLHTIEIVKGE